MTTALIYIRQSRHKGYERTASPQTQEEACRAIPAVKGCDEVLVFSDLDVSGGKRARRGYDAMLQRIADGGVGVVAAYDQSRVFRSTLIAAEFKATMTQAAYKSIDVVFVHGSFDRSPVGGFSYTVLAAAHQMERELTAAKIRDNMRFAASHGEMVGAVPAGYMWEGEGRDRKLVIDEPRAAIVRRVFTDYATGLLSTRAIAYRLNTEQITMPKFTSISGWRADTVAQLLGNPAYIAQTYINRKHREGDPIPAKWPAIIDRGQWDQVQRLLTRFHRKGGRRNQATGQERLYAFQGLLRCAKCGRRMHCHAMRAGIYYDCRSKEGTDPCPRMVREDALLPWAEGLLTVLDDYRDADVAGGGAARVARAPRRCRGRRRRPLRRGAIRPPACACPITR